ncbi:unnamed protein product [Arabis nemorensis]|uniref:Uncharacterized protein n=1 Tax=Arabis nemorensis TaxID=586526 RepID=A0A565C554_9BRAS|nr:unnamed protein product [Arabis nemorensis]
MVVSKWSAKLSLTRTFLNRCRELASFCRELLLSIAEILKIRSSAIISPNTCGRGFPAVISLDTFEDSQRVLQGCYRRVILSSAEISGRYCRDLSPPVITLAKYIFVS